MPLAMSYTDTEDNGKNREKAEGFTADLLSWRHCKRSI